MAKYNDLKDLSMNELLTTSKAYLDEDDKLSAITVALHALDVEPDNPHALFICATIFQKQYSDGISETLLRRALEKAPLRSEIWGALGRCIDSYTRFDESEKYLLKALQIDPANIKAMVNLSNAYQLDNQFDKSIALAEKVLKVDPENSAANDNKGMSYLGKGVWDKGWDGVHYGAGQMFRPITQYSDEPEWDGTHGKKIIIYGEQGLGDEILYGSCIPDAIKDCEEVIVDCDRRLEGLFRRSFPEATVYGTRKLPATWPNDHKWDASVMSGILPMFYRRSREDFPGKPFLVADPVRRSQWRHTLDSISDRPKIGITWNGGVKATARNNRSIPLTVFEKLSKHGDLIDLSHEKRDHEGLEIHRWDHATLTDNYDDTAGLVSELDYVVTACTAIVHLTGGLGVPCHVMVPEKASWRYATNELPWYDSVELHRSQGSWEQVMDEIINDIRLRKAA